MEYVGTCCQAAEQQSVGYRKRSIQPPQVPSQPQIPVQVRVAQAVSHEHSMMWGTDLSWNTGHGRRDAILRADVARAVVGGAGS